MGKVKGALKSEGVAVPPAIADDINSARQGRYILKSRLTARLGLTEYNHNAPLNETEYTPKKVKLLLGQHIGAPAKAVVKKGDKVLKGDVIALGDSNALSVNIHASINGSVTEVNDKFVVIAAN